MPTDHAFHDHFSGHAKGYASSRPNYPPKLFSWLTSLAPGFERAWDAGCGNGQAAVALAKHFREVLASDASAQQIAQATPAPGVKYRIAPAEECPLPDQSCDLITVAQAFHWFNHDAFFAEARRVGRPHAVIGLWCYELCRVSTQIDALVDVLYSETLEHDWPPQRRLIETGYRDVAFPFQEIEAPSMAMNLTWTAQDYLAYLSSWSAVQRHIHRTGADPVERIATQMSAIWGSGQRQVRWPLSFRVGRL